MLSPPHVPALTRTSVSSPAPIRCPSCCSMPASSPSLANAASRLHRQVSRIDRHTAEKLFPREQRLQWPTGYLPASGVAHFLHPDGVPYQEVLECYVDMKRDRQHELQRDFASDYTLWNRCSLEQFVRQLGAHRRRCFTRLTARDRLVHDAVFREVFQLAPYLPPPPAVNHGTLFAGARLPSSSEAPPAAATSTTSASTVEKPAFYQFQPYAATQEYAMLPVKGVRSPQQRVRFSTFPQIRNVLHTDFDSMTALRALSFYCEDGILYTRELVQAVALYVQRRLEELLEAEPSFLKAASEASPLSAPLPTFASESPVLVFFGNGRLAWMLNESGILPRTVRAVQLPRQDAQRRRRLTYLQQQQEALERSVGLHKSFTAAFPCEPLSVGDALRKYRPAIALVEPHAGRDYMSDIRGYCSVREVLALGPIDSPAMGSFAYPFLSFGVTPGPTTYWVYNDNLHKVHASERIQMPMDAPHESQGYERHYVDDISAYLISPNDCAAIGSQFRCLAFRRVRPPVRKPESTIEVTKSQSLKEAMKSNPELS
ncbi:hypothetical protein CUR178_06765 [Leishmania enriettii]|uniref:Uncharacterized protein n=1 Tax=Leishmania enriettii TaxID=5663 RepID=A0A836HUC2_LEIEN|nr:hypothetical protein CUR178_06765 [Leishmania enriettii]